MRALVRAVTAALAMSLYASCGGESRTAVQSQREPSGPEAIRRAQLRDGFVELVLGDTAYHFAAVAEHNNGRVDTVLAPVTSVEDSVVARIVDGALLPLDVGQTAVRVEISPGIRLRGIVSVSERIFSDSVWLARGQLRAWELRPGWHRITVDASTPPGEPQPLELAADLICVPDPRGPKETIVCNVRRNTRILLRHTGAGRSTGPSLAVVTIVRTPR